MAIATPESYADMLDRAKAGKYAIPAINVTSSQTLSAALKGFADAEFGNRFGNFDVWVAAEGFGSGFDCFLVARCEGAQGVLHAVTQLAEDGIG